MTKRILAKYNGITEYVHTDPMRPDDLIIETVQNNLHEIVEAAKLKAEDPVGSEWRHVGYIPDIVMHQAIAEGWDRDENKWRAWLNDPDNKYFRTWKGRIGKPGQH